MRFVIIHGTGGSPERNWFPWLKEKLEEEGHEVVAPHLPGMEDQSLDSWLSSFKSETGDLEKPVFIAHSVGPAFVMNLLERGYRAEACFFVSGFTGLLGNRFDEPNRTITDREFDFDAIKASCPHFHLYHGSDDPYVPLRKAEELADKLDAVLDVIEGGGHLNQESGYTEFTQVLRDIREYNQTEGS